jgi:pyrroline-5-carboxylate reductase
MATYFGIIDPTTAWLRDKALRADEAKAYLAPLFAELSRTALRSQGASTSSRLAA